MNRLISIELLKLRTTWGLSVSLGITFVLTLVSVVTNIELAGKSGAPAVGTVDNVSKTLSVAAVTSTVMLIMGILLMAGEYRHRTILSTYLAEPRRGRVIAAKLVTVGLLGAGVGAVTFGLALAEAVPLYASKGFHALPVDVGQMWIGAILASACYGLLGVALGALTRNTVAAIVGGLVWTQIVELLILQSLVPGLAKWLPTGAGVALTSAGTDVAHLLAPAAAAAVLVGWAALLSVLAARFSVSREVS
jgi:ABC-2 type transport system permease protein